MVPTQVVPEAISDLVVGSRFGLCLGVSQPRDQFLRLPAYQILEGEEEEEEQELEKDREIGRKMKRRKKSCRGRTRRKKNRKSK